MIQALASSCSTLPYGDPFYHPIYEACADAGIPFAVHVGGNGGINTAPHANGAPRYFIEHHALQWPARANAFVEHDHQRRF